MSHYEHGHLPVFKSPLLNVPPRPKPGDPQKQLEDDGSNRNSENEIELIGDDHELHAMPQFEHHQKSSNLELFYDLFFVANLTVFTGVHEVNDHKTLEQYIGFFTILWFTWYQVGLYDVRFSTDSVFERVAKACQFGVMIGFAICGPQFDVGEKLNEYDEPIEYKYWSLFWVWWARRYRRTELPIVGFTITYFVAAMIYLGLFWSFDTPDNQENHSYSAWYVVAVTETIVVTVLSRGSLSFKGTHLGERMSLLTLIILGEGVMGVAEKCQHIVDTDALPFDSAVIGSIVCSVIILYFLYMIYFDWLDEDSQLGSIRSQIWGFSHFPLHLALVLAVQGVSQVLLWQAAVEEGIKVNNIYYKWNISDPESFTAQDWKEAAGNWSDITPKILFGVLATSDSITDTFEVLTSFDNVDNATDIVGNGTTDREAAVTAYVWLYNAAYNGAYQAAGFGGPSNFTKTLDDAGNLVDFDGNSTDVTDEGDKAYYKILSVFELTFIYFFVSIGLFVIINTFMAAVSKVDKTAYHWVRLGFQALIGVFLCLLSLFAVNSNGTPYYDFVLSGWILPTATLSLFLVIVLNSLRVKAPAAARKLSLHRTMSRVSSAPEK